MIVQCDQCNAKFKLDDSKVKDTGVKVRCSKCKHIFEVRKEPTESDFDSILSGLDSSPGDQSQVAAPLPAPPPTDGGEKTELRQPSAAAAGGMDEDDTAFSWESGAGPDDSFKNEEVPLPSEATESDSELPGFDFDDTPGEQSDFPEDSFSDTKAAEEGGDFGFGEFSFSEDVPGEPAISEPKGDELIPAGVDNDPGAGEFDFGDFSFAEEEQPKPAAGIDDGPTAAPADFEATVKLDAFQLGTGAAKEENLDLPSFDFSPPDSAAPVTPSPAGRSAEPEEFSFSDSFGTDSSLGDFSFEAPPQQAEKPQASPQPIPAPADEKGTTAPDSFDFGSFDFGEAAANDVPPPKEAVVPPALQAAPPPVAESVAPSKIPSAGPAEEEDLPPLSVSTRRKESHSAIYAVVGISLLLVAAVAGGGYYLYSDPATMNKLGLGFLAKWMGVEGAEEGSISIRGVKPMFITNQEGVELFVITGEAVNNYKKPRASIQLKALLYGPKGLPVSHKVAYAGNQLSKDQVATMPVSKIEAAMNNQFGDSLANLGVAPGKAIPFTVVFATVPKEVTDFGVEVVGSTVATQ